MNLCYLGDALDYWKGSLLERMQQAKLLTELAVDPMASDAADWTDFDRALFATLLRITPAQIVQHREFLCANRARYFREIAHAADIFLDPDTGIATGRVRDMSQYVGAAELHALLDAQPSRVIAVYQHIRAIPTRRRLGTIYAHVSADPRPFSCCSYESSTVAMLFFSRNARRVEAIHEFHNGILGTHATMRTFLWKPNEVACPKVDPHHLRLNYWQDVVQS